MRKIFRKSQVREVIGFPIVGPELHKYGIPYTGAPGIIDFKEDESLLDYLLAAEERFSPKIHIVSFMEDGRILNRFTEDADFCLLYPGNNDPEIEFSNEFDVEDLSEDSKSEHQTDFDIGQNLSFGQKYAISWSLNRNLKKD